MGQASWGNMGGLNFKEEYIHNIVQSWRDELKNLSKKAEIQPEAAYLAYV